MSDFSDVADFHRRFGLDYDGPPRPLPEDLAAFRERFLQEELDELRAARSAGDLAGCVDALVDLVYVALGTARLMGVPWRRAWTEVHAANMRKVRADSADDPRSLRGHPADVVKPAGWTPPDVAAALAAPPAARWDEYFLGIAEASAAGSRDETTRVGACVADGDRTTLSTGFNGTTRGAPAHLPTGGPGRHAWTVHAEENALLFAYAAAGRRPWGLRGCSLYSTHRPCARCVRTAAHLGVRRAVYRLDELDAEQRAEAERTARTLDVEVLRP